MPHTVGLLIISSRADRVGLVLSKKAWLNYAVEQRTPPQFRMSENAVTSSFPFAGTDASKQVQAVASLVATEILNFPNLCEDDDYFLSNGHDAMEHQKLVYVGSARGNDNKSGRVIPYGKWFHWVAIRLDRSERAFRPDSQLYQSPQWCDAGQVMTLSQSLMMSVRKNIMLGQALAEYASITGEDNRLSRSVHRSRSMAA